jgi:hypothetical protein
MPIFQQKFMLMMLLDIVFQSGEFHGGTGDSFLIKLGLGALGPFLGFGSALGLYY